MKTDDKIELIQAITAYHPDSKAGRNRGWSYYTGGMKDSGDWHFRKLLVASIFELQECLDELIEENKIKPTPKYTEFLANDVEKDLIECLKDQK